MSSPLGPAMPAPDSRATVGELFSEVAEDLSTLMRQEVELGVEGGRDEARGVPDGQPGRQ